MANGFFITAGQLYRVGKQAHARTKDAVTDLEPGHSDALVAILFSAAALEAFINEAAEIATVVSMDNPSEPSGVGVFSKLMEEIENSRGSIKLKFLAARLVFSGLTYDKGAPPYQDFVLLMDTRNALVHLRPRERLVIAGPMEMPNLVIRLESRKILTLLGVGPSTWTERISTRSAARWACNSAAEMFQSVVQAVPSGVFRKNLEFCYADEFKLPD